MSRELLFRAYANGKFWYSYDEAYVLRNYDDGLYLCENESFYCGTMGDSTVEYTKIGKAEQFTGLTDKNGTPVYDGDMLNDFSGRILHIFYCETHCRWELNSLNTEPFKGVQAFEWFDDFTKRHNNLPLIVGNIHENKTSEAIK